MVGDTQGQYYDLLLRSSAVLVHLEIIIPSSVNSLIAGNRIWRPYFYALRTRSSTSRTFSYLASYALSTGERNELGLQACTLSEWRDVRKY